MTVHQPKQLQSKHYTQFSAFGTIFMKKISCFHKEHSVIQNSEVNCPTMHTQYIYMTLKKTALLCSSNYGRIYKMHVYTLVWLKSDQIGFLIVQLKHPDYLIDNRITPACIRSSGSDRILCSVQVRGFSPGLWARSRQTAAAVSFLRNHRKNERQSAPSLCNYHVHHIRSVQRCSFVSLLVRHLSWKPRQLVT